MENQFYGGGEDNPFQDRMILNGKEYELRVVASFIPDRTSFSKYTALFYIPHGGFHSNWWSQERIGSKSTPLQIDSHPFPEEDAPSVDLYVT